MFTPWETAQRTGGYCLEIQNSLWNRRLFKILFRHQPLGMLAQVANQQGKYLAKSLNRWKEHFLKFHSTQLCSNREIGFKYQFLGSMAQLGTWDAVVDMGAGSKGTLSVSSSSVFNSFPEGFFDCSLLRDLQHLWHGGLHIGATR